MRFLQQLSGLLGSGDDSSKGGESVCVGADGWWSACAGAPRTPPTHTHTTWATSRKKGRGISHLGKGATMTGWWLHREE